MVVFWAGGDSESPHKSLVLSVSTQCSGRVRPSYLFQGLLKQSWVTFLITPPFSCTSLFSSGTTNKGRLIAGMEKPMVWPHKSRSRLGWGRSSFLICLFKDKEALSVHMGSSNLTVNYINGYQKVPALPGSVGRGRNPGSWSLWAKLPQTPQFRSVILQVFTLASHTPCLKLKKEKFKEPFVLLIHTDPGISDLPITHPVPKKKKSFFFPYWNFFIPSHPPHLHFSFPQETI